MKILLVDDDPFVLKLLTHQLAGLGCTDVTTTERARDGLSALDSTSATFELIICDLQMPEMDGVEFVRHLVGRGYTGSLILVTGEDARILEGVQKLAEAHKLKVLGALHKPISPEQLRKALETHTPCAKVKSPSTQNYVADDLRSAISRAELANHYEPKVEVASGIVAGVETLVRWQHPKDGLVMPDQFIPLAEEQGLIDELTRAVLIEALRQARIWQDAGLSLRVSVNVSMVSLSVLEFPDFVVREAAKAGIPPYALVLEVTESKVMQDPLVSLDILTRLRLKHIGLSIDDFGTGHSSLVQLRDIPFDELKIDRGFVHGAAENASRRAIFEANVQMARKLGMKIVAEGVEDRADWDFVTSSDCDLAQGYFIGRAMPALALEGWLIDWKSRYAELAVSTR